MIVQLVPELPVDVDLLGIPVFADRLADLRLSRFLAAVGFTGRPGETIVIPGDDSQTHALLGVGSTEMLDALALRRAAAGLARAVHRHRRVALRLPEPGLPSQVAIRAMVEGFLLAAYRFISYKSDPEPTTVERLDLIATPGPQTQAALDKAQLVAGAVALTRDLVNEPGGSLTPAAFADRAVEVAKNSGLNCTVWDEQRIAEERLGGLLGVSSGSAQPPRLVRLDYETETPTGSVALVGKGVTFDSGGLTIKPNQMMLDMKGDMAGAATVLGAMSALRESDCSLRVTGWLPLTDNMPGPDATRIGDVLRIRNGKTVEVLNADAEGRLILADALALAAEETPDAIVDLATLTLTAPMALGRKYAALLGNHDGLMEQLQEAAARAGEAVWPFPLSPDCRDQLDSRIADLANLTPGNKYGQTVVGGLFLREFVPGKMPWAHLDMLGPVFCDADDGDWVAGATGFGVRTLLEFLCPPSGVTSGPDHELGVPAG